jgi:hypothetical protein
MLVLYHTKTKHDFAMENVIKITFLNFTSQVQTPSQNAHALTPTFTLSPSFQYVIAH